MAECRDLCTWFGGKRCRATIHYWYQTDADYYEQEFTAEPGQVAVDEKQIQIKNEQKAWLYAAIDVEEQNILLVLTGVQRYITNADDRPADEVERTDAALAAFAAQHLRTETTPEVYIYTTDIAAGEGAEAVLASEGYGDSITFVNGFRFIEDCLSADS